MKWGKNLRNKIDQPLAKVINKKAQIHIIRNENGKITTYGGNQKNYNGNNHIQRKLKELLML